jgi:hypothetical protein
MLEGEEALGRLRTGYRHWMNKEKRNELQEKSFYSLQHQLTFEYKTHHCRPQVFLRSNIHQGIPHTVQAFAKTTAIKLSPTQKIRENNLINNLNINRGSEVRLHLQLSATNLPLTIRSQPIC